MYSKRKVGLGITEALLINISAVDISDTESYVRFLKIWQATIAQKKKTWGPSQYKDVVLPV